MHSTNFNVLSRYKPTTLPNRTPAISIFTHGVFQGYLLEPTKTIYSIFNSPFSRPIFEIFFLFATSYLLFHYLSMSYLLLRYSRLMTPNSYPIRGINAENSNTTLSAVLESVHAWLICNSPSINLSKTE